MKNILIITSEMVPYALGWGGCQRMFFLSEQLISKGYSVHMFVPKHRGAKGGSFNDKKHQIHLHPQEITYLPSSKRTDDFLYNENASGIGKTYHYWVKENGKKVLKCIDNNHIRTVLISGPYFALFEFLPLIKRHDREIRVIIDYRDSWFLWNRRIGLATLKEWYLLHKADRVTGFSKQYCSDLCRIFHIRQGKCQAVYNGYSEKGWEKVSEKKHSGFRLSYIGSINLDRSENNYRNPLKLIESFLTVSGGREMSLRIVGVKEVTAEMKALEKKSNGQLTFIREVSYEESLEEMVNSDVLLLLHDMNESSDHYVLCGKLYDYMRSGKVLLNIGTESGAMAGFIARYRLGITCENQNREIEDSLNRLWELFNRGTLRELNRCEQRWTRQYARENQNRRFIELIEELQTRGRRSR